MMFFRDWIFGISLIVDIQEAISNKNTVSVKHKSFLLDNRTFCKKGFLIRSNLCLIQFFKQIRDALNNISSRSKNNIFIIIPRKKLIVD